MRESEAWRILAEEHDAYRTSSDYLCTNLYRAEGRVGDIPPELRSRMERRINRGIGRHGIVAYSLASFDGSLYVRTRAEGRNARVLACLMFAEVAKDEERTKKLHNLKRR